jgi:hypothetical protein
MLPENKQNEQKFDYMLKTALKGLQETVRPEFSEKLIAKIRTIEQQNILRKVILQERLLLAGLILFPIAAITIIFAYPAIVLIPVRLFVELIPIAGKGVDKLVEQWRLWACYLTAAAAAIYATYETLLKDN